MSQFSVSHFQPQSHSKSPQPYTLRNFLKLSYFIFSILLNSFVHVHTDIDVLYRKDVCDEKEFYKPYVRLLRTRQAHHENFPILKLFNPGYLSVSTHSGILCINGPAIVYTDINNVRCTKDKDPEWIPSSGEPQIFIHDCFSINRFARDAYKEAGQRELTKETEVFGNKVFGVYLLGDQPDYRLASFVFFSRPDFGYRMTNAWCINNGASVAFVANSSDSGVHCYTVQKYNTEGVINLEYSGHPVFCFREDQDADIDAVWRKPKPVMAEDIVWRSGSGICAPRSQAPKVDYEVEPFQLPDFRMIHPKFWSNQGSSGVIVKKKTAPGAADEISVYSKPNPPGSLFAGEPGWKDPSIWNPEDTEVTTTLEPPQKFQVDLVASDCEEMPKVPDEKTCKDEIGEPCIFLHHVLTLEETDWKSEDLKGGSWRLSILRLVTGIYEKACPQISKFLSSAVARLYQYFVEKAVKADADLKEKFNSGQTQDWTELTKELELCHEKASIMAFFKKRDGPALKLKKKLELKLDDLFKRVSTRLETASRQYKQREHSSDTDTESDFSSNDALVGSSLGLENDPQHAADLAEIESIKAHLNEMPLKFPYSILVGTPDKPGYAGAAKVHQYREAAEVDYELDWALDSFWKVISTVMGYCHSHSSKKSEEMFDKFYQGFSRDFLEYIEKDWIKGENKAIYEQIFGEFIHGAGTLWLEACQNGAYQWSDIVELRPLRPLIVHDGDPPPPHAADGKPEGPPNFFLDNPSFGSSDHYDYYDEKGADTGVDNTPEEYQVAESMRKLDEDRKMAIAEAVVNINTENTDQDHEPPNVIK